MFGVATVGEMVAVYVASREVNMSDGPVINTSNMGVNSQYSSAPRSGMPGDVPVDGLGRGWLSISTVVDVGTPRSMAGEVGRIW